MSQNPYSSPDLPEGESAQRSGGSRRPTSVTVFGWLNIVVGIWGLCGLGFTATLFSAPQDPNMPNPVIELMRESAGYRTFMTVSLVLGVVATVVLITSGVGLLKSREWGRKLAIGYAAYGILATIVGMVVNYAYVVGPMLEKAQDLPPGAEQGAAIGGAVGGVIGGCVGLIYPVLLLIFMLRPKVIAALK